MNSQAAIDGLIAKGSIDENDVLALRRAMYGDNDRMDRDEAETLCRLNAACAGGHPSWREFYIEAMTDIVVQQIEPRGYVSEENAQWLISQIAPQGAVENINSLEALVKILDTAREIPMFLSQFAMDQVKNVVLNGNGLARNGETFEPGRIGRAEVDLLRRILYAAGGSNGLAISRSEAEALFDINDAVVDADNDAEWPDLFVKATANYLMAARGYQAPSRQEAIRRAAWLDEETGGISGFFTRLSGGGLQGIRDAYSQTDDERNAERSAKRDSEIAMSEVVTGDEASWLVDRIGRDGRVSASEKALLMFIKQESPDIHDSLEPLLAKAS